MQKNKFERQMQQKMEELKIYPSASVWQNIEAGISKKKRRRGGWIFFSVLSICLFCGGYFLSHPGINSIEDRSKKLSTNSINEKNTSRHDEQVSNNLFSEKNIPGKIRTSGSSVENGINSRDRIKQISQSIIKNKNYKTKISTEHNLRIAITKAELEDSQKDIVVDSKSGQVNAIVDLIKNKKLEPAQIEDQKEDSEVISIQVNDPAKAVNEIDSAKKVDTLQYKIIPAKKVTVAKHTKVKSLWKWGLSFSGGVSGVPNSFLGSLDKSYSAADALYSYPPQNNTNSLLPSGIKSSKALITGFFAEKNISKKKSITVGFNYKMFSSTNKVGVRNDSAARSYNLSNPTNKYHNHYHFIELPVSLKLQVSSRVIPLFWDFGISLSQLISSNALQFNNISVVYYKENSLFNKTQIGFNTGLSASFFSGKKTSMLIGPCIYYGTTKIATQGLYKNQHFTFIGLRSQVLFKR